MSGAPKPVSSTSSSAKVFSAAGVVAASALAVLLNVAVARHYKRWDLTTDGLYSISPATHETLRGLTQPIHVDVLLPSSDPLAASLKFLLAAYQSDTTRLVVEYTDPDRNPAGFLALQQKYGIEAGRTQDGAVVMDASVIVSREGGKPYFLSQGSFVDVEGTNDQTKARLESSLTTAIRTVLDDERPRICFTSGHGEKKPEDGGPHGLAELAQRLKKNNLDTATVDTSAPGATDPLAGCRVAVVAAPSAPFAPADAERLRAWLEAGGNLLVLANPVPDPDHERMLPLGLGRVTELGGIVLDEDLVFERAKEKKLANGVGEMFVATPKQHAITAGLVGDEGADLRILFVTGRSLSRAAEGSAAPAVLLETSAEAIGITDPFGAKAKGGDIEKGPADRGGPLALAMASELPKPAGKDASHGPRLVVVGAASVAESQSFQERAIRGGALFAENAISWLAAHPSIVDVPDKPAAMGAHIDDASLSEVLRYSVGYLPASAVLVGLAIWLRRRSADQAAAGRGA